MQCETIELHTAELSVARTAVLDYFQSPAQQRLEKIFTWEEGDCLMSSTIIRFSNSREWQYLNSRFLA